jgi:error-prone DNA polymerase
MGFLNDGGSMPEAANPKHRPIVPRPELPRGISAWPYAELDVTTNFSFLRGASHPDELVYRAAELGYAAIAITDVNSIAGVVRAHAAAKEVGIKLCVGTRLVFTDGPEVLVWAENRAGYAHLCRLLTVGKRRAEKGHCKLELADLLNEPTGLLAALVCGSIDPQSPSPQPRAHGLRVFAENLKDAFGPRLSIAISRIHGPLDERIAREAAELGRDFAIPLVATNQVHYHDEHRQALQDVLTCIRHGCTIHDAGFRLFPNGERFLKPPEEMHRLFRDSPEALRRTIEIAERCAFSLDALRYEYPDEIVPAGKTTGEYLADLTWAGAAGRYPQGIPPKVHQQIVHELALIEELKIEPYFLTVYDLVRYARSRDILCQGRGSAANSAVCYCLGVTSVDPDRIDVLFERFVSAARGEPPDIDVDFEHERREEVLQYLYEKYGRERAGMTAEVISYRGRSAVRDVGKAMGLGLDAVDALAKRLDGWGGGAPMEDPLDPTRDGQIREAGLDPADRAVRLTVALTRELLGFPRHLSQHVGGMVMTRGPLCELVPIENASMPDRTVIEWDKDDIDALGILKVDVLALGMLTAIAKAMKLINAQSLGPAAMLLAGRASDGGPIGQEIVVCRGGPPSLARPANREPLELHTIPPEDPGVYAMISDADTVGVFQIESRAQMSMLPRLKPKEFYDLVIEVAIVRPGPIQGDMVHPYLRRRNGEEPVEFPKPELAAVLGKTLGVPLFQEQAMKVAMVAANFTAAEADDLRRTMAAWRHTGRIEKFREKMITGMLANGYELDFAERCFSQIKGFGEYGFPESHAASFALLVYASAWIKRYHPAAFCCALLNSQPMGFYAPAQLVRDAREHGVEIRPVDVNYSDWDCTLEETEGFLDECAIPARRDSGRIPGNGSSIRPLRGGVARGKNDETDFKKTWGRGGPAVRLGFRMIKGLAESFGQRIMDRREAHGPFVSIEEFHTATDLPVSAVTKLSKADVFASLQTPRRLALWETLALPKERTDLEMPPAPPLPAPLLPPMTAAQEIHTDYGTTGLSLKGHPIQLIRPELNRRGVLPAVEIWKRPAGRWVRVAGIVTIRQRPGTAKGIVFETIEDETGVANLIIHPPVFDRYRNAARNASVVQADGYIERQGKVQHVMVVRLHDLSAMVADCALTSRDFH